MGGVMEIRLRGTLEEIQPAYEMFLKRAIEDMVSQTTIEGCRECWSDWQSFQKDEYFIQAKNQMKERLTTKKS